MTATLVEAGEAAAAAAAGKASIVYCSKAAPFSVKYVWCGLYRLTCVMLGVC